MRLSFCSQKEKRDENAMLADLLSWAEMVEDQSRRRCRNAGTEGMGGDTQNHNLEIYPTVKEDMNGILQSLLK